MPGTFEKNNREEKYYSLGELTSSIKNVISKTYTGAYWVKAEIVKLNFYPYSGHCYPDLVEKRNNKIVAQIRATIWAGDYQNISYKFKKVTGEDLNKGMTVLLLARVTYHEIHGLSLNIIDIEPSFTLGEMAREKDETIKKLRKEGVFDKNKLLPFPLVPKSIAVISVETSKGYHDFVNVIDNNPYGYKVEYFLFQALLQGDNAVSSIVSQLKNIASKAELFDMVAIIRGGGGDVGLNAYDNYKLAKAVAEFPLPVITGIGHSTNETVTELVAYENKITPTEVAVFILEKFENFHAALEELSDRLIESVDNIIETEKFGLKNVAEIINNNVIQTVLRNKSRLDLLKGKLQSGIYAFLKTKENGLNGVVSKLQYKPLVTISEQKRRLQNDNSRLNIFVKQFLNENKQSLKELETKLNLLKPENVLKRGYSLTVKDGRIIKSVDDVDEGDKISTRFFDGTVISNVEKKKRINNKNIKI